MRISIFWNNQLESLKNQVNKCENDTKNVILGYIALTVYSVKKNK